jgi:clan AA aspartic protease
MKYTILRFCVILVLGLKSKNFTEVKMGTTYAEITLQNAADVSNVGRGYITEKDVRQITLRAMVDTGAYTLVINEEIREKLGLAIEQQEQSFLADGTVRSYGKTEPIKIYWENRMCNCSAVVVPGAETILLGAIPLEDMDLIVNPKTQELIGAHGKDPVGMIM